MGVVEVSVPGLERAAEVSLDRRMGIGAFRRAMRFEQPVRGGWPTPEEARELAELAAGLLEEPSDAIGAMRIHAFLRVCPLVGEVRMRRLLGRWGPAGEIWPLLRVRDLTDRQRYALAKALRDLANDRRPR